MSHTPHGRNDKPSYVTCTQTDQLNMNTLTTGYNTMVKSHTHTITGPPTQRQQITLRTRQSESVLHLINV